MKIQILFVLMISALSASAKIEIEPIIWVDEDSDQVVVTVSGILTATPQEIRDSVAGMVSSLLKSGTIIPKDAGSLEFNGYPALFIEGNLFSEMNREFITLMIFSDQHAYVVQATGTPRPTERKIEDVVKLDGLPLQIAIPIVKEIGVNFKNKIPEMIALADGIRETEKSEPVE
jgi:hypothetical protein